MWNREVGFRFYVFTRLVPRMTTSGGSMLFVLRFSQPRCFSYALR